MKWFVFFLIISKAYSQDFIEDMSKITHVLSEEEVDHFVLKPGPSKSVDGTFLKSMAVTPKTDPDTNCEENPTKGKPLNLRYEVVAVTQEKPKDPTLQPQTTVIVARYEERENPLVSDIKNMIANQVVTGKSGGPMGKFQLKQHRDAGKTIVLYAGPGTSININSSVKAEGAMNVDVNPLFSHAENKVVTPTIQMDVVNRLSVTQEIAKDTTIKTQLETFHTTGVRGLDSLDGTKFNLSTFRAQTRVDAKLNRSVQSYTEVNYTSNSMDKEVRAVAGFDIKAPNNAQILVFTGYTNKSSETRNPSHGTAKELGFEYKPSRKTTIFSKFSDGMDRRDKKVETGIRIQLGP